jgi:hypothetical protein
MSAAVEDLTLRSRGIFSGPDKTATRNPEDLVLDVRSLRAFGVDRQLDVVALCG